jgi:hypothetical protein
MLDLFFAIIDILGDLLYWVGMSIGVKPRHRGELPSKKHVI